MRTINLRLKAFGPFKDEINIEFDKFGKEGLFLISGQTGAGKTSIFDAIIYALYGISSGGERDEKMLQFTASENKTTTFVELTFEYKKEIYTIYREFTIRYSEKTKKKTVNKFAWIKLPNGEVIDGITDTTNKIVSLLGINKDQYTQIAMLAQGKFMKLLKASSEKKKELFRDIFNTQKYDLLDREIYSKLKETEADLKALEVQRDTIYNNINIDSEDEDTFSKSKAIGVDNVIIFVKEINNKFNFENKELNKEIRKYSKSYDEKNLLKDKISDYLERIKKINENKIELEKITPKYEDLKNRFLEIPAKEINIDSLKSQLNQLENELKLFETLENIQTEKIEINSKLKLYEDNLKELKIEIQDIMSDIEDKKQYILENKGAKDIKVSILNEENSLNLKKEKLNSILDDIKNIDKFEKEKETKSCSYLEIKEQYNIELQKYNHDSDIYFESQAGILAETLMDNVECPVCGSTYHPNPAKLSHEVLSKDELDKEKIKVEKLRKDKEELQNEISKIDININQSVKNMNQRFDELDITRDNVENFEIDLNLKISENKNKLVEINSIISNIDIYENNIEELETLLKEKNIKRENENNEINIAKENKKNLEKREIEEIDKLENKDKDKTIHKKEEVKEFIEALSNEINYVRGNYQTYSLKFNTLSTAIKTLSENLDEKYNLDINKVEEEIKEIENNLKNLRFRSSILESNIKVNNNQVKKLENIQKDLIELEKKRQDLKELSDIIRGKIKGVKSLKFETFIQFRHFNNILIAANSRFIEMTEGKYSLKRKENPDNNNEQIGLDFEVIDHHNKSLRNINTLSGGESFQAALSLALGLSDLIQKNAGGIQLDSMFVDEGFGTLDKETLSKVMSTLYKITNSNKLIGIISHVETLKEQIDKQIIVEKTTNGYSILKNILY